MNGADAERDMSATLAQLGLAETALGPASATIARRPSAGGAEPPLPALLVDGAGADLATRGELGRGGMGVVRLADQHSLSRSVALKTSLSLDAAVVAALVREARIMGSLEHPNLVPVHALGIDPSGAPVLVMKRIEGVSWRALLADPAHEGWRSLLVGHDDRLRASVEVLSQVCRALAFAHDRGVVHRDLKPDNVMIGRFGEVYLLDWGVALRLAERDAEPRSIVGTPAYMAPEMARGVPALVEARTDVYLLGATLYEVLVGHPPHAAPTPLAALVSALLGEVPPVPDETPADLALLVRRAMAPAPADRVAGADAFLEDLRRFLASREAEAIVRDARAAVARAEDEIARNGPASSDAFQALVEGRFGFVAARRARPHDESIHAALDGCVARLVEREIALRSPGGARAHLGELALPREDLEARIGRLEKELEDERAAAAALRTTRREADTSVALGAMERALSIGALVAVPGSLWQTWDQLARGRELPGELAVVIDAALLGVCALALYVGRRTAFANEATRRVSMSVVLVPTTILAANCITLAGGGTTDQMTLHGSVALACVVALASLTVLRDLWPIVVLLTLQTILGMLVSNLGTALIGVTTPVALLLYARAIRLEAARSRVRDEQAVDR